MTLLRREQKVHNADDKDKLSSVAHVKHVRTAYVVFTSVLVLAALLIVGKSIADVGARAEGESCLLTFDAGAGSFDNGETTNVVEFQTIPTITRYSHTPNYADDGTLQNSTYDPNLNTTDVITINGAETLEINIKYGTESGYDWVCIWEGAYPTYSPQNDYSTSRQLMGSGTRSYTISGESVTFGFHSDGSINSTGYYATIVRHGHTDIFAGVYQEPVSNVPGLRFVGWMDDDGILVDDWHSLTSGGTLTAAYADYRVSFDANGGSGQMNELLLDSTSVAPTCAFTGATGYVFAGWNTAADGTGTQYLPSDELPYTQGSFTLYAQWTPPETYAVFLDDGTLVFFRGSAGYAAGSSGQEVMDIDGNTYVGQVYRNFINVTYASAYNVPWRSRQTSIKSVRFAQEITPTSTAYWFANCTNLTDCNLTHLNTSNVSTMRSMFYGCTSLQTLDLSDLDCRNLTTGTDMFMRTGLKHVVLGVNFRFVGNPLPTPTLAPNSSYSDKWHNVTTGGAAITAADLAAHFDGNLIEGNYGRGTYEVTTRGNTYAIITDSGDLVFLNSYDDDDSIIETQVNTVTDVAGRSWTGTVYKSVETIRKWSGSAIRNVYVAPNSVYVPNFLEFSGMNNLSNINFEGFNTHYVTNLNRTFSGCSSLTSIDLSGLDTSAVTSMQATFEGCSSLVTVNLSGIDTSSVTYFREMFAGCSALRQIVGIESLNTRSLTAMESMFSGCTALENLDLSSWDVRNLSGVSGTFYGPPNVNLSNWNAPNISTQSLLQYNFSSPYIHTLTIRNARIGANRQSDPSSMNLSASAMTAADFSGSIFYDASGFGCSGSRSLQTLNMAGVMLPKATGFSLAGCGDLVNCNLNNISCPLLETLSSAFASCYSLITVDLSTAEMPRVKHLNYMFAGCSSLQVVNLAGLQAAPLENTSEMFVSCRSLVSLDLSMLDTSHVTYMSSMFADCPALVSLDISSFDTHAVTTMSSMFANTRQLQRLVLGEQYVFVGEDSLPEKVWKNIATGDIVEDLWQDYDGTMMAGTYVRARTTITEKDLYGTNYLDNVTFNQETGEVVIYLKTPDHAHPAPVLLPALGEYLEIDANIVRKYPRLKSLFDNVIAGNIALPDLKISVYPTAYADITSCSRAGQVLFTFDVPKSGIGHVRIDLQRRSSGLSSYSNAGYLENSDEEPRIFRHYDERGRLIEVLVADVRHTKAELRGYDPEEYPSLDVPALPEYPAYETYNATMDNYEVMVVPGRYRMIFSTPSLASRSIESVVKDNLAYQLGISADAEANLEYLTLFNAIQPMEYKIYTTGTASLGKFKKVNALSSESGVAGATYRFTSLSTGNVYYGTTLNDGSIQPYTYAYASSTGSSGSNPSYTVSLSKGVPLLTENNVSYWPSADETFDVEEVSAPNGYYLNPSHSTVTFLSQVVPPQFIGTATANVYDGVTATATEAEEYYFDCLTCGLDSDMCLCGLYGSCTCQNCGTSSVNISVHTPATIHSDMPYPQAYIYKKDDVNSFLAGAHLQVLDDGEVVDDWTSDGRAHILHFVETGTPSVGYLEMNKEFVLHEVETPGQEYRLSEDIPFTVSYDSGSVSVTMVDVQLTSVSASKAWYNRNTQSTDAPSGAEVVLSLVADGTLTGDTVTLDGVVDTNGERSPWVATFSDLPVRRSGGSTATVYSVRETTPFGAYRPDDEEVEPGGTITNQLIQSALPITGLGGIDSALITFLLAVVAVADAGIVCDIRRRQIKRAEDELSHHAVLDSAKPKRSRLRQCVSHETKHGWHD